MLAYLDGTGDALAGRLRPGNANANTAADQIAVLADALEQLLRRIAAREPVLLRADSAGATHKLLEFCHDGNIRFSVGLPLSETVRQAILRLPEAAWQIALQRGRPSRTHARRPCGRVTNRPGSSSTVTGCSSSCGVSRARPRSRARRSLASRSAWRRLSRVRSCSGSSSPRCSP